MKLSHLICTLCACVMTMASVPASAATVDQSQLLYNGGSPFDFGPTVGDYPNYPVGQSFTAGLTGLLTQIDVFSNGQIMGTNDLTMELREGDGTAGTLLGSTTISVGNNAFDFGLGGYTVSIDTTGFGVNVTPGSVYTFLFTNVTGSGDLALRGILTAYDTDPYAGGRAYEGPGYGDQPTWDQMFQTHVQVSAVPIPAAAWLFGSGLLGLIGVARRKVA